MLTRQKPKTPVDRALDDVSRQIQELEQRLRTMDAGSTHAPAPSGPHSVAGFLKQMLAPPSRRTDPSQSRIRRELPADETNVVVELDNEPLPFAQTKEPDLFDHAGGATVRPSSSSSSKLMQYLAAGSTRPPKPVLKSIQRRNRHSFFIWLGLSLVAVWLIITVVR